MQGRGFDLLHLVLENAAHVRGAQALDQHFKGSLRFENPLGRFQIVGGESVDYQHEVFVNAIEHVEQFAEAFF